MEVTNGHSTRREKLHALPWRHPAAHPRGGRELPRPSSGLESAREARRIERTYRFKNFREAFVFVERAAALAETEGHHPEIRFGWGFATVSLHTKKIKGLHENDFIIAAKLDRIAADERVPA